VKERLPQGGWLSLTQGYFRAFPSVRRVTTLETTCRLGRTKQHLPRFRVNIFEVVMTETLEILLWCAALAAWLMLLFAFVSNALKPPLKSIRRVIQEAFKVNVK
jgi:hypothetical protein